MKKLIFISLSFILFSCANNLKSSSRSEELISYASAEGIARISRSQYKADFFILSNNFESQENGLYCGPTTAAIVLNSMRIRKENASLPKDDRAVTKKYKKHLPKSYDGLLGRYTPEVIVDKSPKHRSLVFGKPTKVNGKEIKDFGYQIRQFSQLLNENNLNVELRIVDDSMSEETIKKELIQNLKTHDDYVIVNYKRSAIGQTGGGHISPLGAYDESSDSFLVLDVNPTKAPWVWVPSHILIRGMRTFDTVENRGYLLVSEK